MSGEAAIHIRTEAASAVGCHMPFHSPPGSLQGHGLLAHWHPLRWQPCCCRTPLAGRRRPAAQGRRAEQNGLLRQSHRPMRPAAAAVIPETWAKTRHGPSTGAEATLRQLAVAAACINCDTGAKLVFSRADCTPGCSWEARSHRLACRMATHADGAAVNTYQHKLERSAGNI